MVTDTAGIATGTHLKNAEPVVIIGAGPAGLAAAARLSQLGVPAEILEWGEGVASSWRQRYDRMRMNTCRWNIMLWFGRFPRRTPTFPTRDEFVRYMESYVSKHDLQVRFGVKVDRIDRVADGWRLATSAGERTARTVIVATGHERDPKLPDWPGHNHFPGRLLHSAQYRNPREFRGADVLVVGSGCSGMDIAGDLVQGGAGRVRLAVRTQPHIVLRHSAWGPNDLLAAALQRVPTRMADSIDGFIRRKTVGDLVPYGLALPEEGTFAALGRDDSQPTIVDPDVIEAIKAGRIEIVAGVSSVDAKGVQLNDGTVLWPDTIIAATGFSTGLEPLVGHLGVLDDEGMPHGSYGSATTAGLYFLGYEKGVGVIGPRAHRATRDLGLELAGGRRSAHGSERKGIRPFGSMLFFSERTVVTLTDSRLRRRGFRPDQGGDRRVAAHLVQVAAAVRPDAPDRDPQPDADLGVRQGRVFEQQGDQSLTA
jgi:putative flavoprotein involved in K+ transport